MNTNKNQNLVNNLKENFKDLTDDEVKKIIEFISKLKNSK